MLARTIQRQVTIGDDVRFLRKDGQEIAGRLIELSRDHITLDCSGKHITILLDLIGGWEVMPDVSPAADGTSGRQTNEVIQEEEVIVNSGREGGSDASDESGEHPPDSNREEALKTTLEIEARFQAKIAATDLAPLQPDFDLSAERHKAKQVLPELNRIKSKFEYALKVNELGTQFGRIQPLISELEKLAAKYPDLGVIFRLLGYFRWLVNDAQKSAEMYKTAAQESDSANDWYGFAALVDNDAFSLYGLNRAYAQSSVSEFDEAWYCYVNLVHKHKAYSALVDLSSNKRNIESEQASKRLLEACLFLLTKAGNDSEATSLASRTLEGEDRKVLLEEASRAIENLFDEFSTDYVAAIKSFESMQPPEQRQVSTPQLSANVQQGSIYSYKTDRIFGFIRGVEGKTYFFHRSAVSDEELREQLRDFRFPMQIQVTFETAEGPKGPIAFNITLPRLIEEAFERAEAYAENGDYPQAIDQIKKVLNQNPDYPDATELYEKWRSFERIAKVPRGRNPYARAKRVQLIEKDLDKAVGFFRTAIQEGDHLESAVKDLASLQVQMGNAQESVRLLERYRNRIGDRQSVDNMLIGFHQKAGQYDKAIGLLEAKLAEPSSDGKKAEIQSQIANCYLRKEDYESAKSRYEIVMQLQPSLSAQRNVALCVFKLGDFAGAEKMLKSILEASSDSQAEDLLEAITKEHAGLRSNIEEIILTTLTSHVREISGFAKFFLDRCELRGVPTDRVHEQEWNKKDVQKIVNLATRLGTRNPRERAEYYLSAVKILLTMEDSDPEQIYRYLCRSFASRADAAVREGKLDAARDLYAEALNVYSGLYADSSNEEQDAISALVRFLFSTLGETHIPMNPSIPNVDETLEKVLIGHSDRSKGFEAIAYLLFRSRFAANRILKRLYNKASLQAMAVDFLKSREIEVQGPLKRPSQFGALWNELVRRTAEDMHQVSSDLRSLLAMEISTTASLESSIACVRDIPSKLFLELDQERHRKLERVFASAYELCRQSSFEEQERLCIRVRDQCQALLNEIEVAPTKVSIEELFPVVHSLRAKISERLRNLYEQSTPELTLKLALESYKPDANGELEVQIAVGNKKGRSPAEALELVVVVPEDNEFTLTGQEIRLDSSLRGDEQSILFVPLKVGKEALKSQAFSLPVYAQFRRSLDEIVRTEVESFPIHLYPEADFETIENPYSAYAAGGIVGEPEMFYGRDELIANVANSIRHSTDQSKCVVIFGQKRAGKSSILYHLEKRLREYGQLLVINIGNLGSTLDPHSEYPLLHHILWTILQKLQDTIEDQVDSGMPDLGIVFPSAAEFYSYPTQLGLFKQVFEKFQRTTQAIEEWQSRSIVLLIDEFSYLHGLIEAGHLPDTFMKNWKALLQENFFNAVLVGQDVMPKFQQRYPNEFGATQDERVTYLKREDAIRLIDEPMRRGGINGESRYRERAIGRILELTAGSPFYIQILCNRLVEYMNAKNAIWVTQADVERIKDDLIRGVNALGLDKFDNLINSGDTSADAITDEDALAVLREIARNSTTTSNSCSQDNISCNTESSVGDILDDLEKRDVLERQRSNYYSIRVGIFKDWLLVHQ